MQRQKPAFTMKPPPSGHQGCEAVMEELDVARKIHDYMIPRQLPGVEGLEIASLYLPSEVLEGNLFDVLRLSEDLLAFFIFDIAARGISAALLASMARVAFGSHIRAGVSPSAAMERVHADMMPNILPHRFVAATVVYLDMHDYRLVYCTGGNVSPIIYRAKDHALAHLPSTQMIAEGGREGMYGEKSAYLHPGDRLLLLTDGTRRAIAPAGQFDEELLKLLPGRSPQAFLDLLQEKFAPKSPGPGSAITALVIELLKQSEKNRLRENLGFKEHEPVYLQFINYFEEMDRAASAILADMDAHGFPDETIRRMKIILSELFANAVYHGNNGDYRKKVTIAHSISDKKIMVSIMDEGEGFDPEKVPDPTLPENIEKTCGRGLYIVANYVDKLEFNAKGNRVTVTKYQGIK